MIGKGEALEKKQKNLFEVIEPSVLEADCYGKSSVPYDSDVMLQGDYYQEYESILASKQ